MRLLAMGGLGTALSSWFPELSFADVRALRPKVLSSRLVPAPPMFRSAMLAEGLALDPQALKDAGRAIGDDSSGACRSVLHELDNGGTIRSTAALLDDGTVVVMREEYSRAGRISSSEAVLWEVEGEEVVVVARGSDMMSMTPVSRRGRAGDAPSSPHSVNLDCGIGYYRCPMCVRMNWLAAVDCCGRCFYLLNGYYPTNPRLFIICIAAYCPYCLAAHCTQWGESCCALPN